jgi:hypothetical protein
MARHTKIKVAALAASFVATVGLVAVGPATSADAGKTVHSTSYVGKAPLCC